MSSTVVPVEPADLREQLAASRVLFVETLEEHGYEVIQAGTGQEALECLAAQGTFTWC